VDGLSRGPRWRLVLPGLCLVRPAIPWFRRYGFGRPFERHQIAKYSYSIYLSTSPHAIRASPSAATAGSLTVLVLLAIACPLAMYHHRHPMIQTGQKAANLVA
jgi:hypothetical protein